MDGIEANAPGTAVPLVLDLDGTLLRTDLLYETFWAALGHDVAATLGIVLADWRHPQLVKHRLAGVARPRIDLLPLNDEVVALAEDARRQGRPVHLVSAADQGLVDEIAHRLGLPGPHFGSTPDLNLKGQAKAGFLTRRFGREGYDYVGNDAADLEPWRSARRVIAVAPRPGLARRIAALGKPVDIVGARWQAAALLRELRPHQWVKNLLLFVPVLAIHQFEPGALLAVALAAVAFSFGASSIYILNDLLDLAADRSHPEKRSRPIASGALPIPVAMVASAVLATLALTLAFTVGPGVAALTQIYMIGSLVYSLWLKKRRWVDVLTLAALFLLRVMTGGLAAQIELPPVLLGFGYTVFFVLACVKRLTEISRMPKRAHLPGRGYFNGDRVRLKRVALAGIAVAAALFLIYVWGPHAASLYRGRLLPSLVTVPLVLWLFRIVQLSAEGREDYDPVRFVLRDRVGLILAFSGILMLVLAA